MKKITIEKFILVLASGFAAYNYGLAGRYIEGTRFSAGGLAAGIVVNVSLAIASSQFGSLKGIRRTRQAMAAFAALLMLSPLIVSPVIYYSLPEGFLGSPILRAVWALAWPLTADLAIVLAGAISGRGLIALSPQSDAPAAVSAPSADALPAHSRRTTRAVRRSADAVRSECAALATQYACTEAQCAWKPDVDALIASVNAGKSARSAAAGAKAGHVKNKHPKPIEIDPAMLINRGEK